MDWPKQVIENERILIDWYRLICQSGHGDITVEISQSANRIEIRPTPRIRDSQAQRVFDNL